MKKEVTQMSGDNGLGAATGVATSAIDRAIFSELTPSPTADQVLGGLLDEGLGRDFETIGLAVDEVLIEIDSTLAKVAARCSHGCLVVGIRQRDGRSIIRPATSTTLSVGDVVVVVGFRDEIFGQLP